MDSEIKRREFNGHTLVLLKDCSAKMMKEPGGISRQYIIALETITPKGRKNLTNQRYISNLMRKLGFANAEEAAIAIFTDPYAYKNVLGENWYGYKAKSDRTSKTKGRGEAMCLPSPSIKRHLSELKHQKDVKKRVNRK